MKIRPLHDRVIVKRLEEERTSPGGIVIPDTAESWVAPGHWLDAVYPKLVQNSFCKFVTAK